MLTTPFKPAAMNAFLHESLPVAQCAQDQATQFFRNSEGHWRSERRYYTLKSGLIQEVVSQLQIRFLQAGDAELQLLSQAHGLEIVIPCGVGITWDSQYAGPSKKNVTGSTVFGLRGDVLYRDRGFATPKPITAQYTFPNPNTMVLRTEYDGSVFEEEIKLISHQYRTRQTVISRAGEEQMIGQYLERRIA